MASQAEKPMRERPGCYKMMELSRSKAWHTWDVLHQDTSRLGALILLQEPEPQAHNVLAVLPQQLQHTVSLKEWHLLLSVKRA